MRIFKAPRAVCRNEQAALVLYPLGDKDETPPPARDDGGMVRQKGEISRSSINPVRGLSLRSEIAKKKLTSPTRI